MSNQNELKKNSVLLMIGHSPETVDAAYSEFIKQNPDCKSGYTLVPIYNKLESYKCIRSEWWNIQINDVSVANADFKKLKFGKVYGSDSILASLPHYANVDCLCIVAIPDGIPYDVISASYDTTNKLYQQPNGIQVDPEIVVRKMNKSGDCVQITKTRVDNVKMIFDLLDANEKNEKVKNVLSTSDNWVSNSNQLEVMRTMNTAILQYEIEKFDVLSKQIAESKNNIMKKAELETDKATYRNLNVDRVNKDKSAYYKAQSVDGVSVLDDAFPHINLKVIDKRRANDFTVVGGEYKDVKGKLTKDVKSGKRISVKVSLPKNAKDAIMAFQVEGGEDMVIDPAAYEEHDNNIE